LIIPSDASNADGQKAVAEAIRQAFGGLDVLFLNAGIAELRPVERWDEHAFDHSFATNVKSCGDHPLSVGEFIHFPFWDVRPAAKAE
jgi:NAD(P)-dependent dehydrogenase (short-subunit alcohol dehydrogenase family)